MKIARFESDGGAKIGIVRGEKIIGATGAIDGLPTGMNDLIGNFENFRAALSALSDSQGNWQNLSDVKLLAPVERPGKILAKGLNYADHIAETGHETPKQQIWFTKAPTAINGPYDPIELPRTSPESVDYEVELVAVIGKGGRHISREDAPKAVFGYCVGNDVSVREWQGHSPQWSIAKSFDTHAPIGPWITLSDELPDPHGLAISCAVNGETWQNSNTANLVFDVWAQIEYLSKAMTLEPGDLIFTGTPGGIGWMRNPRTLLSEGDMVRCEIEKLGVIEGRCEYE